MTPLISIRDRRRLHTLLGKRYEFAEIKAPDVIVVGYNATVATIRVVTPQGHYSTLDLRLFLRCVRMGSVLESTKSAYGKD